MSSQLATLKREICDWVMRSSQDTTAAMILAEDNVVMAKANRELRAQVQQFQADQRRQTEVLNGLLTNSDFGLPTTVLNDAMPSGQALLDLLDLPGHYSRLIGNLCKPYAAEHPSSDYPGDARCFDRVDRATIKSSERVRSQCGKCLPQRCDVSSFRGKATWSGNL